MTVSLPSFILSHLNLSIRYDVEGVTSGTLANDILPRLIVNFVQEVNEFGQGLSCQRREAGYAIGR